MSTFEELKDKALHAASVTADAAKQLAIISKCRVQIVAEQEKIRALYAKLGKVYYKDYVTDEEPDEAEYEPLCDSISAHYRKISRLRELMEEAKSNYQAVKKNSKEAKQQRAEEEDRLMVLANEQKKSTNIDGEDDLLEELNNLNHDTPYGEILD